MAHGTQTRSAPLDSSSATHFFEVIGKIEVVVVQKRHIPTACQSQALVMWTGLVAEAASQIHKPDAWVAEGGNALGRVVGAGGPRDYEPPDAERRIAQAMNFVPQHL